MRDTLLGRAIGDIDLAVDKPPDTVVRALEAAIAGMDGLVVKKVIAEYICFDSNRAVDNGWLEPADG